MRLPGGDPQLYNALTVYSSAKLIYCLQYPENFEERRKHWPASNKAMVNFLKEEYRNWVKLQHLPYYPPKKMIRLISNEL